VFSCGIQRTRREPNPWIRTLGIFNPVSAGPISSRTSRNDSYKGHKPRAVHPKWFENILPNELLIRLAADLFQQVPERDISQVCVCPLFTGLKIRRHVTEQQVFRGTGFILGGIVGDAGCMRKQVIDGDLVPRCGRIREIPLHKVIRLQFAAILKEQNRGGGELLRHRSDVESSRGGIWNVPLQVRHSIALAKNDLSIVCYKYASHKHLGIDIRLHNLLESVGRLSTGWVNQYCNGNRKKYSTKRSIRQSHHPGIIDVEKSR